MSHIFMPLFPAFSIIEEYVSMTGTKATHKDVPSDAFTANILMLLSLPFSCQAERCAGGVMVIVTKKRNRHRFKFRSSLLRSLFQK